jgi:hypothetical protein
MRLFKIAQSMGEGVPRNLKCLKVDMRSHPKEF